MSEHPTDAGGAGLRSRRWFALAVALAGALLVVLGLATWQGGELALRPALFGPGLCWAGIWFLLFPSAPGTAGAPPKWWFVGGLVVPGCLFLLGGVLIAWLS